MKNMKNLLIASALGLMAAGSHAASIVPGTERTKSVDVVFTKPGEIVGDITPVKGLMATRYQAGETIATLTAMTSDGNDVFAVAGDYDAKDYDDASITWSIVGKNDPQHKIKVKFETQRSSIRSEKYKYGAHTWMIYPNGEAISIKTAVAQEIAADVYPLTMHLAMYYK